VPAPRFLDTPMDLKRRLEAERKGAPFLFFRDGDGNQAHEQTACSDDRLMLVLACAAVGAARTGDVDLDRAGATPARARRLARLVLGAHRELELYGRAR